MSTTTTTKAGSPATGVYGVRHGTKSFVPYFAKNSTALSRQGAVAVAASSARLSRLGSTRAVALCALCEKRSRDATGKRWPLYGAALWLR